MRAWSWFLGWREKRAARGGGAEAGERIGGPDSCQTANPGRAGGVVVRTAAGKSTGNVWAGRLNFRPPAWAFGQNAARGPTRFLSPAQSRGPRRHGGLPVNLRIGVFV